MASIGCAFPWLQDKQVFNYLVLLYSTESESLKENELWDYACGIKKEDRRSWIAWVVLFQSTKRVFVTIYLCLYGMARHNSVSIYETSIESALALLSILFNAECVKQSDGRF